MTGVSIKKLNRSSGDLLRLDGSFDRSIFPDCNVFNIGSFAALCDFKDPAYFRDVVLSRSDSPIHFRMLALIDELTGRRLGEIYATAQNSAVAGGVTWRMMKKHEARGRALAQMTDTSSRQVI